MNNPTNNLEIKVTTELQIQNAVKFMKALRDNKIGTRSFGFVDGQIGSKDSDTLFEEPTAVGDYCMLGVGIKLYQRDMHRLNKRCETKPLTEEMILQIFNKKAGGIDPHVSDWFGFREGGYEFSKEDEDDDGVYWSGAEELIPSMNDGDMKDFSHSSSDKFKFGYNYILEDPYQIFNDEVAAAIKKRFKPVPIPT